jgi:hypothetical protein
MIYNNSMLMLYNYEEECHSYFSVEILYWNIVKLSRIENDCTSICFLRIFHNITSAVYKFFWSYVLQNAKYTLFQCKFPWKIFHPHLHSGDTSTAKITPPQSDDISLCYNLHTSNLSFKVLKFSEISSLLLQTS